jgi:hypothetical protein
MFLEPDLAHVLQKASQVSTVVEIAEAVTLKSIA